MTARGNCESETIYTKPVTPLQLQKTPDSTNVFPLLIKSASVNEELVITLAGFL